MRSPPKVQLLQREGATQSPAAANGSWSRIGASSPAGGGDTNGFGSAAGEKRFADLLDSRLGEERHVQVGDFLQLPCLPVPRSKYIVRALMYCIQQIGISPSASKKRSLLTHHTPTHNHTPAHGSLTRNSKHTAICGNQ